MARDGKVSLGRKQITMQLGQLFVDRASINLHSDILDNPDYFWLGLGLGLGLATSGTTSCYIINPNSEP